MSPQEIHDAIAACIKDHMEFCCDLESSANCAAAELTAKIVSGNLGIDDKGDLLTKEWVFRYSEQIGCEPRLGAIAVGIEDLQSQLASAKRMIAKLRSRQE